MKTRRARALLLLASALLICAAAAVQEPAEDTDVLGAGPQRYRWVPGWPEVAPGALGSTHGDLIVDSAGLLYVNTDTEDAIQVFAADGRHLRSFGSELAGGLHGMCLTEVDGREALWLAHTGRHEVLLVTLEGEVLRTLGWPEASGHYAGPEEYRPTGVAVAPDGTLFVTDGYGAGWVHRFDAQGRYLDSFGGPGEEPGTFRTPHGIWVDRRESPPVVLVADRENGRVQRFTLAGELVDVLAVELRRPCQIKERGGFLAIADLAGRVTLLDASNRLVAHLGDNPDVEQRANQGVPPEAWRDGTFTAPHAAAWDADGNLFVMDWNRYGRVSKLERLR